MKFESNIVRDVLVISVNGEIMGDSKDEAFRDHIYEAIKNDQVNIVVDLAKATWMNSSGLGTLISALTTARSSGGDLKLANVSDRIRRPIEITKLNLVFSFFNSKEAAIESYRK